MADNDSRKIYSPEHDLDARERRKREEEAYFRTLEEGSGEPIPKPINIKPAKPVEPQAKVMFGDVEALDLHLEQIQNM